MSHRHGDQSRTTHPHMPWRSKSAEDKRSAVEDANGSGGSGTSAAAQQEQQHRSTSRRQAKSPSPSATAAVREGSDLRPTGSPDTRWDRSPPESSARAGAIGVVSPASGATGNNVHNSHIPLAQSGGTLPPNSFSDKSCPSPTERPMRSHPREQRKNDVDDKKTGPVAIVGPAPAVAAPKARLGWQRIRPGNASNRRAGALANSGRLISPTSPAQGDISGSHMTSEEGSRRVGVAGTAVSNRGGGVLPSGTRPSNKGVMRRKLRVSAGATRITSGEVSYQIGQEIGRGGCGAVFQALNMATGDFVAIKRMEMDSVRLDAGASIKGEIDLLKKLNHPNIVKYIDTIQTEGHLHIVLELMESSLSAICKRFGNLSEPLTATYMTQVLEGLKYLHDQGVLHRDIKGANILTTKDGLVKLADFGVAMKLSDKQAFDVDVVGTPYWMAPEIIEMTGTTTACDVWSVGCTIIELLMGKPPYFDLPQMTALYKIVQDDHPPLPDGITQALRDFLLQCFKKQAQMRRSAMELLRHPWLKKPTNHRRKSIEVGNAELTPGGGTSAAPPPRPNGRKGTIPAPPGALAAVKRKTRAGKDGVEDSDEDWDRDMGLSKLTLADDGSSVGGVGYQGRGSLQAPNLTTIAPTSEEAKQKLRALQGAQDHAADLPLIPKTLDANALDDWGIDEDETDNGFTTNAAASVSGSGVSPAVPIPSPRRRAAGGTVPLGVGGLEGPRSGSAASPFAGEGFGDSYQNSPLVEAVESGGREGVIGMEASVLRRYMEKEEDEDDGLVFESTEVSANQPIALGVKGHDDAGEDGSTSTSFAEDLKARMLSHQEEGQAAEEADDGFEDVFGHGFEDLIDDDDDGETGEKVERELHAKVGQDVFTELSRLEIRKSFTACSLRHPSKSLRGLSELRGGGDGVTFGRAGRLQGPGTALPGVQEEGEDAAREKTGNALEEMDEEEMVVQTCVRVCSMLDACPQARHYVMSADRGVTPLMYLMQTVELEGSRGEETMANVLAVINKIVDGNLKALETLAMIGLVPKVIAVLETRGVRGDSEAFSKMRVEAARLVRALCNGSDLTLQTFISCGGLAVLVQFLGEGPRMDGSGAAGADARRLVRIGIDGVLNVFSLQSHTAYASYLQRIRRNEFCKLFLRLGLVPRIMGTFTRLLGYAVTAAAEPGRCLLEREASVAVLMAASGGGGAAGTADTVDLVWPYLSRATEILTTFSKGDSKIKEGMAEEQCMKGIMGALLKICPTYLNISKFCDLAVSLLTVLKNVTMEPSTLEALDQAGAITTLVLLLGQNKGYHRQRRGVEAKGVRLGSKGHEGGGCDGALENQILQCMFYLCRLSRKRQEKAAVAGLIPHLKRCVLKQSMLKQFALQMACDFAHASSVVRSLMWDEGLLDFYLSVMRSTQDRHWHVTIFGSLCAWLTSEGETDRVAARLVEPSNLERVIFLFSTAQQFEFEDVVDKLHLMMDKSVPLVKSLGSSAMFVCEVVKRLHYPKAVVGKTLLGMLRQIHQHHSDPKALVRDFDLYKVVLKLSQNDSQVLVAELADQLLQDLDTFQALMEGGDGDGTKGVAKEAECVI